MKPVRWFGVAAVYSILGVSQPASAIRVDTGVWCMTEADCGCQELCDPDITCYSHSPASPADYRFSGQVCNGNGGACGMSGVPTCCSCVDPNQPAANGGYSCIAGVNQCKPNVCQIAATACDASTFFQCGYQNKSLGTPCATSAICDGAGLCQPGCAVGGKFFYNGGLSSSGCQRCDPGTSTTSLANINEAGSCGAGSFCHGGACLTGCVISGQFYAVGDVNPANPCQTCQPASSTSQWTGAFEGQQRSCSATQVCHTGACATGCGIAGQFYAANTANGACQSCRPDLNAVAWSPSNEAQASTCSAGSFCHAGACAAGCSIGGAFFADKSTASAGCQVCNAGATSWAAASELGSCGTGSFCHNGACLSGCVISGQFQAAGDANPLNPCQTCQPGLSTSLWTSALEAQQPAGCTGTSFCHAGACAEGCVVSGTFYSSGAASGPCRACLPATSTQSFSATSEALQSTCSAGNYCHNGACAIGCSIGGAFYDPGALNGGCQTCAPGTNTTDWTAYAEGQSCATGKVCHLGGCQAGCFIGAAFWADLTTNPANSCQRCDASKLTTDWSPGNEGAVCGPNKVCSSGQCGSSCSIGGVVYGSGVANPANSCQLCTPASSAVDWTASGDGTSCGVGKVCSAAACKDGCYLGSAFRAPGAASPADPCQVCAPATSTAAWTTAPDGAACAAGKICSAGQCVAQCLIDSALYGDGASNPVNACQYCDAAGSPRAWKLRAEDAPCGAGRYCRAQVCTEGCLINGAFYSPGAWSAADDSCHVCRPTASGTAFSPADKGTACASDGLECTDDVCDAAATCTHPSSPAGKSCGLAGAEASATSFCFGGLCEVGCLIDGVPYRENAVNAADRCQRCNPYRNAAGWSQAPSGSDCGDGTNRCTAFACSSAGACNGSPANEGSACGNFGEVCRSGNCTCSRAASEFDCGDGIDNDCDGTADCDDGACAGRACKVANLCFKPGTTTCQGKVCKGDPKDCSQTSLACRQTPGSCDPITGECSFQLAVAGTECVNEKGCRGTCTAEGTCQGSCDKAELSPSMFACGCASASGAAPLGLGLLGLWALRRRRIRPVVLLLAATSALSLSAPASMAATAAANKAKGAAASATSKKKLPPAPAPAEPAPAAAKAELAPPAPPSPEPPAAAAAAPAVPSAAKRRKIAVLPLRPGPGTDQKLADLVAELLSNALARRPNLSIVSSKDIEAAVGFDRQRSLLGCSDSSCLTDIGGALGVDKLVNGTLGKLGSTYLLSVQLIDAKKATAERRFSARAGNATEEALIDIVEPTAKGLLGETDAGEYVADARSGWAPTRAPVLTVKVRGQLQAATEIAAAAAATVGWQPIDQIRLSAGLLAAKTRQGMVVNLSWLPWNAGGQLYPLLGIEAPIFFDSPLSAGAGVNIGLEYAPVSFLAIGLEVPAYYFLTAPPGKDRGYVFGALSVVGRL